MHSTTTQRPNHPSPQDHTSAAAKDFTEATERVGAVLQRLNAGRVVEPRELEQHILDCGELLIRAMELGNRQEAEGWQQAMYAAIGERDRRFGVDRHAAFERDVDNGVGYFAAMGERARAELQRRSA